MANTVACFKWVVDDESIIVRDDLTVDFSRARGKISEYDRHVLQAAAESARVLKGISYGLTFGGADVQPALRDSLSRGIDEVYYIADDLQKTADGAVTAKVLAATIKTIPDVALVFCAEGASDTFARQTGPRLAACLGWPVVSSVCRFEVQEDRVIATRLLDDVRQTVKVTFPAVLSITAEAAGAPLPSLRAIMASAKKPQHRLELAALGLEAEALTRKTEVIASQGYKMVRKNIIFDEGSNSEKLEALLKALIKEGILC
ncbi:MAG TPA: electron transfer flavoprotein beta subunit/FixA family protein [Bacillota bacterium]|nr:electron transfer flavoprotein beta subunit/FixA family protein [Bacillota bacterium]